MMETNQSSSDVAIYCTVGGGKWHRVISQTDAGVTVDRERLNFREVWSDRAAGSASPRNDQQNFLRWEELDVPLPDRTIRCWGFALTYPDHRSETLESPSFRFMKKAHAESNSKAISYRDYLDYELEIGILMHRDAPHRFGYFLANDLTDRGVQVENYDPKNPAPGFGKAKSFDGALRAGPLLAVGGASLWPHLSASLELNGETRQTINAANCNLDPDRLHEELFSENKGEPWLMVATGTSAGTMFRVPKTREKVKALVAGKFSMKRAGQAWLNSLRFLVPGDRLVLRSPILGKSEARLEDE